jgi:hypothetical protein
VLLAGGAAPRLVANGDTLSALAARPKTATIEPRFAVGVPTEARAAFTAAAFVWEHLLASDATIVVDVDWRGGAPEELLAITAARRRFKDAAEDPDLPLPGTAYPAALANSIRGRRLNDLPDMDITVSSSAPWYMGTDGDTPDNSYDLVSVLVHEMAHGFGLTSSVSVAAGRVTVRGSLTVYDALLVDAAGAPAGLRPGVLAADAGVAGGGSVFFGGAAARKAAGGSAPRLFTPYTWQPGSSVTHLDTGYSFPNANHLLTPAIPFGIALQDPGPIPIAMLMDMGWRISGLGERYRIGLSPVPAVFADGVQASFPLSVRIEDPIANVVTTDSSTTVTLNIFGIGEAFSNCGADLAHKVSAGVTAYSSCSLDGVLLFGWFRATAPDLITGRSNAFSVFGKNIAFLPMAGADSVTE